MKHLLLILLLTTFTANADNEFSFIFGGWSKHINVPKEDYTNEVHDLIGFRYKNLMVSPYFKNSHGDTAQFVAWIDNLGDYQIGKWEYTSWYAVGVAFGYNGGHTSIDDKYLVLTQGGGTILYNFDNNWSAGVNLSFTPMALDEAVILGSFNVTYRF